MGNYVNGNDYAFASADSNGLTKREYFAAMAMQGVISNSNINGDLFGEGEVAVSALALADALIAELNKETK